MNDMIYLDNSATTPLCDAAKNKMSECFDIFGNPSSLHTLGTEAEKLVKEARRIVLSTLGIRAMKDEQDRQLVFTSCGSEATSLALFGCAYAKKRREANRIIDESVGIEERVPLGKRIVTFLLGKGVPAVIGLAVGLLLGLIF